MIKDKKKGNGQKDDKKERKLEEFNTKDKANKA